jgi:hypothetical protein
MAGMKQSPTVKRLAVAAMIGLALTTLPAISQHHFRAGSLPDLVCELMLLPGSLFATLFHDRGNASPEFLLRSWLFTAVLFSGLVYKLLPQRRNSN